MISTFCYVTKFVSVIITFSRFYSSMWLIIVSKLEIKNSVHELDSDWTEWHGPLDALFALPGRDVFMNRHRAASELIHRRISLRSITVVR